LRRFNLGKLISAWKKKKKENCTLRMVDVFFYLFGFAPEEVRWTETNLLGAFLWGAPPPPPPKTNLFAREAAKIQKKKNII